LENLRGIRDHTQGVIAKGNQQTAGRLVHHSLNRAPMGLSYKMVLLPG
jgi:hypothetical protein